MKVDTIGDIIAIRTVVQQLYAAMAIQSGGGNAWLEQERGRIFEVLGVLKIEIDGVDASKVIRERAESTVNTIFDSVRVTILGDGKQR
jgi:hypothetical protein